MLDHLLTSIFENSLSQTSPLRRNKDWQKCKKAEKVEVRQKVKKRREKEGEGESEGEKEHPAHSLHLIRISCAACCLLYRLGEEADEEGKPQPVLTKGPGLLLSGKANSCHPTLVPTDRFLWWWKRWRLECGAWRK